MKITQVLFQVIIIIIVIIKIIFKYLLNDVFEFYIIFIT